MIRWCKFNAVGIGGALVQLAALWIIERTAFLPDLLAIALAVEIALLHNFVWHEVWTWKGARAEDRWRRLGRFHVANGLVSILSNTLFTWLFKHYLGWPLLVSNLTAMSLTSVANFALASVWVFRPSSLSEDEAAIGILSLNFACEESTGKGTTWCERPHHSRFDG
jgi:putative flippase GtrA